ncbi:MAG: hypothetical protein JXD22_01885 [Sedimentisphaerales bacterium]|nr:hypothetical protein [Sedimentisphaerales bacterium]
MDTNSFDKIFPDDAIPKRKRVEYTLKHQPVDRVAVLEQLSYNSGVISIYTCRKINGFNYTIDDICAVIRKTTDIIMPPTAPRGTDRYTTEDGFVMQNDNWNTWHVSRPFSDEHGARDWLMKKTEKIRELKLEPDCPWLAGQEDTFKCRKFDADIVRENYRQYMLGLQQKIGDSVILNFSTTGMCAVFDAMGLEIFSYFYAAYPEVMHEYLEVSAENELLRIHAVADKDLSPVILIPEDFSEKRGPIFPPAFLQACLYPYVKKLTDAWHEHDITALFHSDGNYLKALPSLIGCGVDGFYCLEPAAGMDVVNLKNSYPGQVWAGGLDGVELMEHGTPDQVRKEVHRHIRQTNVLQTGGMFLATSSEINPPVKPENFKAMVDAAGEIRNPELIV